MSTRTEELKERWAKASVIARANKKDDVVQALDLMLELVVELHERIDDLESRLRSVENNQICDEPDPYRMREEL